MTAVYISRLELEKSEEISRSLDINEIENLLYYFEADLTNALNLAGMKALKEMGKHPVIIASFGTSQEINQFRMKAIIKEELNVYLTGHYLYNMFSDGHYTINVLLQNETPILSIDNISFQPCSMQLERFSLPLIGPLGTMNYSTYFVVSIPLHIEIRQLMQNDWILLTTRTVRISSILTSRYPLLECLMNEYQQTINGSFSSLWTYTTMFSNLYTLLRGFKHFRTGRPLNVMDNRHLSLILNSGLLLEQGLVFGSVDPLGLVDLARELRHMLKQTPSDALTTFNKEMDGEGYLVETKNLSRGSANADAGSPINESIDITSGINLSEIAERILYTINSTTFHFENNEGETSDENVLFEGDVQTRINELIQKQANQSFYLTGVTKHLRRNATTLHTVENIISEMYHDTLSTKVLNRSIIAEQSENPGEGWNDGGCLPWNVSSILPISKQEMLPQKGQVIPGCVAYEEHYIVFYERKHIWWRIEEYTINGTIFPLTIWNNKTDLLNETVIIQTILQHWSSYQATQDDIVDILYFNETLNDLNLEDTIVTYLSIYNDTNTEKQRFITVRNNTGTTGLNASVPGVSAEWVIDESWGALETIMRAIQHIIPRY